MSTKKKPDRKFEVELNDGPNKMKRVIPVVCQVMTVNHRGDLLGCRALSNGSYGSSPDVVAGFKNGTWVRFEEVASDGAPS